MQQWVEHFQFETQPHHFMDITGKIERWVAECDVRQGLLTLFIQHTSASLVIQENADPDVLADLGDALDRLAPEDGDWRHRMEGPDDLPGHIKSALTPTSLSIPVLDGALALGTWQAIYIAEHRAQPHSRRIVAHLSGVPG